MYNTIYIFLKFVYLLVKKLRHIPDKNKSIFSKPKVRLGQLTEGFRVSSVKTYSNWWSQTPDHDCRLVRNYILLSVTFGFKFKTGLHVTIYYLSLTTCRGKWLLRMIPSVFLFKIAHGITSNINWNQKIHLIDRWNRIFACHLTQIFESLQGTI